MSRFACMYQTAVSWLITLYFGKILNAKLSILESSTGDQMKYRIQKVLAFNCPSTARIYSLKYSLTTTYQVRCLSCRREHRSSYPTWWVSI